MSTSAENTAPSEPLTVSAVEYTKPVGKKLFIKDGKLASETLTRSPGAKAIVKSFPDLNSYWKWRVGLGSKVCLLAGNFEDAQDGAPVGYKDAGDETISATKDYLGWREGGAVMRIDIDTKRDDEVAQLWTQDGSSTYATHEEIVAVLRRLYPFLDGVAMGVSDSSSAMVYSKDGEQLSGSSGYRVEIAVDNGEAIPEILQTMHDLCWAQGDGNWGFVSKGGSIEERSLVDLALAKPTQPDFAKPTCRGVESKRGHTFFPGGVLAADAVTPLDEAQRVNAIANLQVMHEALAPKSRSVKAGRKKQLAVKMLKLNPDNKTPGKIIDRMFDGVVYGDLTISIDGDEVTADELVRNGADYDGKECLDPREPDYRGQEPMGKFYWNDGNNPQINAFAHGEHAYCVRIDAKWIVKDMVTAKAAKSIVNSDDAVRLLALMEGSASDCKTAIKKTAVALGLGNGTKDLEADVACFRRENRIKRIDHIPDAPVGGTGAEQVVPLSVPILDGQWPIINTDDLSKKPSHMDNYRHMFKRYGLTVRWNQITKELDWGFSNDAMRTGTDNAAERLKAAILSMCNLNGLSTKDIGTQIIAAADANQHNPVTDYLKSLKWDGKQRIYKMAELCGATNQEAAEVGWDIFFIAACAAADAGDIGCRLNSDAHPSFEYVITIQGPQGINKTKGMRNLHPKPLRHLFKEAVTLDVHSRDNKKEAVSSWVCELGELDATFRKSDISALKGFISQQTDELRLPYGAAWSKYARRTLFVGTVNPGEFLHDETGNRRFIPFSVERIPALDDETVEQMWAEGWGMYASGVQWWPTTEEDAILRDAIRDFEEDSAVKAKLREHYEWGDEYCRTHPNRLPSTTIYADLYPGYKASKVEIAQVANAVKSLWEEHTNVDKKGETKVCKKGKGKPTLTKKLHVKGGRGNGWLVPLTILQSGRLTGAS